MCILHCLVLDLSNQMGNIISRSRSNAKKRFAPNPNRYRNTQELLDNAMAQQLLRDRKYGEFLQMVDARQDDVGYYDFRVLYGLGNPINDTSCMLFASECEDAELRIMLIERIAACGGLSVTSLLAQPVCISLRFHTPLTNICLYRKIHIAPVLWCATCGFCRITCGNDLINYSWRTFRIGMRLVVTFHLHSHHYFMSSNVLQLDWKCWINARQRLLPDLPHNA